MTANILCFLQLSEVFLNNHMVISCESDLTSNQNISQQFVLVDSSQKLLTLHNTLQEISGLSIIFIETKKGVDWLYDKLFGANYNTISIHGDKPQEERNIAITKFKNGQIPILIATDVASRGLDFPKVEYVFNYDMPSNIDDYVHRIGRTARCGNKGTSISFINESDKPILKDLISYLKQINQTVPSWLLDLKDKYAGSSNSSNNSYFYNKYRQPNNEKGASGSSFGYSKSSRTDDYSIFYK